MAPHVSPDPAASLHDVVAVVQAGLAEDHAWRMMTVVVPAGTAARGVAVAEGSAAAESGRMVMA